MFPPGMRVREVNPRWCADGPFVPTAAAAGISPVGSAWGLARAQAATNPQSGYAAGNGLQPGSGKTSPEEDVAVIAAPTLVVLGKVDVAPAPNTRSRYFASSRAELPPIWLRCPPPG